MHPFDDHRRRYGTILLSFALALGAAIAVVLAFAPRAKAWSGCGVGVAASHMNADANAGGPIGLSSSGNQASALVNCDWRFSQIVIGGEVSYGIVFGDLETLGAKRDLTVTGRAGVLASDRALPYLHVGWDRLELTGAPIDHLNGIKFGAGIEVKLADSPLYFDLRYSHSIYDVDKLFGPGIDVSSDTIMAALKIKFGPKYQLASLFEPEVSAPCDPKMANCKKK
jgi:opacity protein-like surface antigen